MALVQGHSSPGQITVKASFVYSAYILLSQTYADTCSVYRKEAMPAESDICKRLQRLQRISLLGQTSVDAYSVYIICVWSDI